MRTKGQYIFWSIWNVGFFLFDAFFAWVHAIEGEWGWVAFFVIAGIIMLICQAYNEKFYQRGKTYNSSRW